MKTYIHNARVGLFIGLLLFNALSSCVHTRQELGISWGDVKRSYRLNPWPWRIGGAVTTVAASAAGVFGGMEAWRAFGSFGNGNPVINGTDVTAEINATDVTDVTTIASLAPTGEPIINGTDVTAEINATDVTDVTDVTTIASLAPTGEPTKRTTVPENVTSEVEARLKRSLEKAKEEGWG